MFFKKLIKNKAKILNDLDIHSESIEILKELILNSCKSSEELEAIIENWSPLKLPKLYALPPFITYGDFKKETECVICCEKFNQANHKKVILPCNDVICVSCYKELSEPKKFEYNYLNGNGNFEVKTSNRQCPFCRKESSPKIWCQLPQKTASDAIKKIVKKQLIKRLSSYLAKKNDTFSAEKTQKILKTLEILHNTTRDTLFPNALLCDSFKHGKKVNQMAFSPNGNLLAVSCDKETKLWDLKKKSCIHTFENRDTDSRAEFSPCGNYLATYSTEDPNALKVWNLQNTKAPVILKHSEKIKHFSFRPTGKYIMICTDKNILFWKWMKQTIHLHDGTLGKGVQTIINNSPITRVTACPNGNFFATACDDNDNTVKLWCSKDKLTIKQRITLEALKQYGQEATTTTIIIKKSSVLSHLVNLLPDYLKKNLDTLLNKKVILA